MALRAPHPVAMSLVAPGPSRQHRNLAAAPRTVEVGRAIRSPGCGCGRRSGGLLLLLGACGSVSFPTSLNSLQRGMETVPDYVHVVAAVDPCRCRELEAIDLRALPSKEDGAEEEQQQEYGDYYPKSR